MATLVEARLTHPERLALDRFLELLHAQLTEELVAVWLYGSRARGERRAGSDIDLMVVTRGGRDRDLDRVLHAAIEAEMLMRGEEALISPFVTDPGWLAGRRAIDSFFMEEVDRDKIVLVGAP